MTVPNERTQMPGRLPVFDLERRRLTVQCSNFDIRKTSFLERIDSFSGLTDDETETGTDTGNDTDTDRHDTDEDTGNEDEDTENEVFNENDSKESSCDEVDEDGDGQTSDDDAASIYDDSCYLTSRPPTATSTFSTLSKCPEYGLQI